MFKKMLLAVTAVLISYFLFVSGAFALQRVSPEKLLLGKGLNMVPYHPNKAIKILNKVLLQNPNSSDAYNGKGRAYLKLGKYKKAIYNFKKAILLNPKSASAYNGLGISYIRDDKKNKGCLNMAKAYKLNSRFKGTLKYYQKIGECPLSL